ncbi:hypothetical protein QVD99_000270 [Batrachochytrium dendrobatidis]|nr:hypothetical protein O5D80_006505 [Batrachochytrium dendrobatidis]KAK5672775.1 hypothetical protein QVD99_000270 [Batrachochytrium dendrobatidis]
MNAINPSLLTIERQFWQNVPMRSFQWGDSMHALQDPNVQDQLLLQLNLLSMPTNHITCKTNSSQLQLRVSKQYMTRFLKGLTKTLEAANIKLSEQLYVTLANTIGAIDEPETICHRYYFLPQPFLDKENPINLYHYQKIALVEEIADISQGTTGLRTWQAGLRMIEYMALDEPDLVVGRRVLELGSGIGLLGLAISLMGAKSVCMTDVADSVLDRLSVNIALNTLPSESSIQTIKLDWEWTDAQTLDAINQIHAGFDVIVGADIVYSPLLIDPLVNTITNLLKASNLPAMAECWISSTKRHEATQQLFQDRLNASGLVVTSIPLKPAHWFHYDENANSVQILHIKLE